MSDRVVDNLFPTKTQHKWVDYGTNWGPEYHCVLCHTPEDRAYGTQYCEDVASAKLEFEQKASHTHRATEDALNYARKVLTEEQWKLIGIKRPYREKDYLKV